MPSTIKQSFTSTATPIASAIRRTVVCAAPALLNWVPGFLVLLASLYWSLRPVVDTGSLGIKGLSSATVPVGIIFISCTLSIGAACLVLVLNSINLPVFVAAFVASRILDPADFAIATPLILIQSLLACLLVEFTLWITQPALTYSRMSLLDASMIPYSGIKRAFKDLTPRQSVSTTHRYFLSRKLDIVASETRRSHLAVLATGRDNSAIKSHATSTSHQPTSGKSNLRRLVLVEKLKLESPAPNVVGLDIALDSRYPQLNYYISKVTDGLTEFLHRGLRHTISELCYVLFLADCLIGFWAITLFNWTMLYLLSVSERTWNVIVEHRLFCYQPFASFPPLTSDSHVALLSDLDILMLLDVEDVDTDGDSGVNSSTGDLPSLSSTSSITSAFSDLLDYYCEIEVEDTLELPSCLVTSEINITRIPDLEEYCGYLKISVPSIVLTDTEIGSQRTLVAERDILFPLTPPLPPYDVSFGSSRVDSSPSSPLSSISLTPASIGSPYYLSDDDAAGHLNRRPMRSFFDSDDDSGDEDPYAPIISIDDSDEE